MLCIKCVREFFTVILLFVLVGVSAGDPLPEGQLVGPLPQGMTTHTVCLIELPALRQTDVSHLSDILPPAHDALTGR